MEPAGGSTNRRAERYRPIDVQLGQIYVEMTGMTITDRKLEARQPVKIDSRFKRSPDGLRRR